MTCMPSLLYCEISQRISLVKINIIWKNSYAYKFTYHISYINKWANSTLFNHCGLVTSYGDIDLDQQCFRLWIVAWRHQPITWTNVDLSPVRSGGIHLRAILQEIPQPPVTEICMQITYLKCCSNLPGANELSLSYYCSHIFIFCQISGRCSRGCI